MAGYPHFSNISRKIPFPPQRVASSEVAYFVFFVSLQIIMARQRKIVGAAALLLSTSPALSLRAVFSSRRASSCNCRARSQEQLSSMQMITSLPKEGSTAVEAGTKPTKHRLHVQVLSFLCLCLCARCWW